MAASSDAGLNMRKALFVKLAALTYPDLLRYLHARLHGRRGIGEFEEQDILQEAYLRIWRKRRTFHGKGPTDFCEWAGHRVADTLKTLERLQRSAVRRPPVLFSLD